MGLALGMVDWWCVGARHSEPHGLACGYGGL